MKSLRWILITRVETKMEYEVLVELSEEKRRPGAFRSVKQKYLKCDVSYRSCQA